jgi:hypothetical protein
MLRLVCDTAALPSNQDIIECVLRLLRRGGHGLIGLKS